jgi:plastocyanin
VKGRGTRTLTAGLVLLAAGVVTACEPEPPPVTDRALRDSLGIAPSVTIHRIVLGGRGGDEHLAPARLEVAPGDLVQFLNVDRRIHTVAFRSEGLSPEGRRFLRSTSQLESPPLLHGGSRFVVTFRDAPPGEYPFVSEGAGGSETGIILVRTPDGP